MIIYHGGYCEIKIPQIIKGKYTKDFGEGFYCTEIKKQAERWCIKYDDPVINAYEYKENKELNILKFDFMTEEWLNFIVSCRNGVNHDYDVVIGAMANDQIYNFINTYIRGLISREAFWALAKFKYPTHQIAFCSKKSLGCLKYLRSERGDKK
jgi:hypothetical protein